MSDFKPELVLSHEELEERLGRPIAAKVMVQLDSTRNEAWWKMSNGTWRRGEGIGGGERHPE